MKAKYIVVVVLLLTSVVVSGCLSRWSIGQIVKTTVQYNKNDTFTGKIIEVRNNCDYRSDKFDSCQAHYSLVIYNSELNDKRIIDEDLVEPQY